MKLTQEALIVPGDDTWDSESNLPSQPFDIWTRTNVGENLPFPITPLTATHFPIIFQLEDEATKQKPPSFQMARRFYGRLYFNEGAIVYTLTEEYGLPASFLDRMWGSRRRGKQQGRGRLRPLRLMRKLPGLLRQGVDAAKQQGPKQTPTQFFGQIDQWVNTFLQQDINMLDDRALWAQGLPVWAERGGYVFKTNLRISTPSAFTYAALEYIVRWWTGRKELAQDLVTGLVGVYNAEVGPALWQMTQVLSKLGLSSVLLDNSPAVALLQLQAMPEAQPFIKLLKSFLQRHGHRCPNELEMLNPRWAEAPEQVIELVANYLRSGTDVNPIEAEKRQRQRRIDAVSLVEAKLDPLRRALFRVVLKRAQQAVTIRDNSRYFVTKFIFPVRRIYATLGQRWAERGWLQRAEDIFFLTIPEIQSIVATDLAAVSSQELQERVAKRRMAYDYWLTVVPPDALGADGKPISEEEKKRTVLEGVAASGGRVRGRARIVLDVREAMQLTAGEILVTQATDPGWTPVFPLVSGIVLEIGGQLSHGAIVAREYAIPAVVNVRGALGNIKDGQTIVVDGSNGHVYLE